jgi:uncharacterized membrane protein YgaE (UPF0421/DUF939 family)
MVGIGYRTIKTAIGAGIALALASFIDWQFATFAAIIVIMCIEKTKKRTLVTIKDKLFSSLLSLVLGMFVFEILAYHPVVITMFILLFIPILVKLRIQNGFVTSMVVLLHIYSLREANLEIFINELIIISIGMGIALLVNSIMPSRRKEITNLKYQVEKKYGTILYEFHAHLLDGDREWDGIEIHEAEELIDRAKSIVMLNIENQFSSEEHTDYYYFKMRADQLEILKRILSIVSIITSSNVHVKQKEMLAYLFLNISENVHSRDIDVAFEKLNEYEASVRETTLPLTREEFEIRANLVYINFEIKNYLSIKKEIMDSLGGALSPITGQRKRDA